MSITPLGWNVIGLDSNDVTSGPDQFEIGAKVCNLTGSAITDISVTWNWGTANAYLNLDSAAVKTISSLAGSACTKLWWTVTVTRDTAAWNSTRTFTITASATGVTSVTTPAARELYVEKLVSQNRNGVTSLTGPTNVVVGDTVTYVLDGYTATNGYEQLDAGPILDGSLFEITSISATYNKPSGATNDTFYANACGWDPVTSSGTYRSCIGPNGFTGGKAGGDPIHVSVTAKVIAAGTGNVGSIIYDFSGSSYHYNSDFSLTVVTSTAPPTPSPPVAVDDSAGTAPNVPVLIDVPANDSDPNNDLDVTSVSVTGAASNGNTSVNPVTGKITYTPNLGFSGTDTFTYQICDLQPVCDTALVTVTVDANNPVAVDDTAATLTGVGVPIDVTANDTDVDGDIDPTSVNVTVDPSNGTTSVDPVTGVVTYTPTVGFVGTDTFTYQVCDMQPVCDTAVVTITVTAPPVAVDDSDSTTWETPVTIDVPANDTDLDGDLDLTSVTVTSSPGNGSTSVDPVTGEITYTPDTGFAGTDSFIYQICDLDGNCDSASVTVTVTVSNPVANDDSDSTTVNTPVTIDVPSNDTDADGDLDLTSVTVTSGPANGGTSVDSVTGEITYTPDLGFTGTDTFTYRICDSQPVCDTATVTVTVSGAPSDPVANDDSDSTSVDTPVTIDVPSNDTDADDDLDLTSVTVTVDPSNGTTSVDPVTGEITYTPDTSFTGTDTFTYEICDSQPVCDTATATVTVGVAPSPPVAGDNSATTTPGHPVVIYIEGNDSDPDGDLDPASVTVVTGPAHGEVVWDLATLSFTYTPDPGYEGTDSFTYQICDLQPVCSTALVTLAISDPVLGSTGVEPTGIALGGTFLIALGLILRGRRRQAVS